MKTHFTIIVLLAFSMVTAQVGIGTTTPNAQLDVRSSNQATPENTDGILIPKTDEYPTTNPTAAQDGMLLYATGNGSVAKGFYYWDNAITAWVAINTGATSDADFYEEGATTAPDNINDDIYTQGNVAIGKTTADAPLDILTESPYAIRVEQNGATDQTMYGLSIENSNSGNQPHYGVYNTLSGAGPGLKVGNFSSITSDGGGTQYGTFNDFDGLSTDMRGLYNDLTTGAALQKYGVFNEMDGDNIYSTQNYGVYTNITGNSDSEQHGIYQIINNSGVGIHYGLRNNFIGSGDGTKYGVLNEINTSANGEGIGLNNALYGTSIGDQIGVNTSITGGTGGEHTGVKNEFGGTSLYKTGVHNIFSGGETATYMVGQRNEVTISGSLNMPTIYGTLNEFGGTDDNFFYGIYQNFNNTGNSPKYGVYNIFSGNTQSTVYGIVNDIGDNGNGDHYGSTNSLYGTGGGAKYGFHTVISTSSGGDLYGLYSEVPRNTGNAYAGYFIGDVQITDGALMFSDTTPPTPVAGQSGLFSASGELNAIDAAGNTTVISPHHFKLVEPSEDMAWSFYSKNDEIGKQINVDMLKAVRLIEALSGEKLIYLADLHGNRLDTEDVEDSVYAKLKYLSEENKNLKRQLEKQQNDLDELKVLLKAQ
jgi:trimeric autotransporter adhesin